MNHFKKLIKANLKIWMQKLLGFSNKMWVFILSWKLGDNPIWSDFKPWFIDWEWIDCILFDILDSPVPSPAAGLRFRLVHGTLDTTNQQHISSKKWSLQQTQKFKSMQPDGVNLWFELTELVVWNIKSLRLWVAKVYKLNIEETEFLPKTYIF